MAHVTDLPAHSAKGKVFCCESNSRNSRPWSSSLSVILWSNLILTSFHPRVDESVVFLSFIDKHYNLENLSQLQDSLVLFSM